MQLTKSSTSQFSYCVRELMTTHENHEGVAAALFRSPCDKRLNFINDTLGGAQSEQWGESPPLSTEKARQLFLYPCHSCCEIMRQPEVCRCEQGQGDLQLWEGYNP